MRLIRSGDNQRVTVLKKDGMLSGAETHQKLSVDSEADIAAALKRDEYQTITTSKQDGRIVNANRKRVFKFTKKQTVKK